MSSRPSGPVLAADPLARVAELPGVREAADTARAAVDTLLRHRVLRRRSAEVTAEASLRAARASAALEGYDVELDALRGYLSTLSPEDHAEMSTGEAVGGATTGGVISGSVAGGVTSGGPTTGQTADGTQAGQDTGPRATRTDVPGPVTLGTVRLYGELGVLAPAWERAPRQALARMHVLLGRGFIPDDQLGRPRADAGGRDTRDARDPLRLGPPPHSVETSVRLDGLTGLLVAPSTAPAIVVAAVVHGELLALRPFGELDGVIARAAARLVLISRGLDPKALTATDVGHLEVGELASAPLGTSLAAMAADTPLSADEDEIVGYRDAAAAYVAGGVDGVTTWVRHCAKALELAARESLAICEALDRS